MVLGIKHMHHLAAENLAWGLDKSAKSDVSVCSAECCRNAHRGTQTSSAKVYGCDLRSAAPPKGSAAATNFCQVISLENLESSSFQNMICIVLASWEAREWSEGEKKAYWSMNWQQLSRSNCLHWYLQHRSSWRTVSLMHDGAWRALFLLTVGPVKAISCLMMLHWGILFCYAHFRICYLKPHSERLSLRIFSSDLRVFSELLLILNVPHSRALQHCADGNQQAALMLGNLSYSPTRSVILRPAKGRRDTIWKLLFLMRKGFLLTGFWHCEQPTPCQESGVQNTKPHLLSPASGWLSVSPQLQGLLLASRDVGV